MLTKVDLVVGCYCDAESEAASAASKSRGVELPISDVSRKYEG